MASKLNRYGVAVLLFLIFLINIRGDAITIEEIVLCVVIACIATAAIATD